MQRVLVARAWECEVGPEREGASAPQVNVKACADDVKKHCADVQAGEGRLEACMKSHVADVSDACKVAMANAAAGED